MDTNFRRNRNLPYKPFSATLLQVRRAWEAHFGGPLPLNLAFRDAALMVIEERGFVAGRDFIQAQSLSAEFLETDYLPYSHPKNLWRVSATNYLR